MAFTLREYKKPDFNEQRFLEAPDAVMAPAPADSVAPTGFHAMSIFPEYFKVSLSRNPAGSAKASWSSWAGRKTAAKGSMSIRTASAARKR